MISPWPIIFAALVFLAGLAAGGKLMADHRDALELSAAHGRAEALEATAKELAKISVKNVTINKTLETQIKTETRYETCKNTPEVMKTLNESLKGPTK